MITGSIEKSAFAASFAAAAAVAATATFAVAFATLAATFAKESDLSFWKALLLYFLQTAIVFAVFMYVPHLSFAVITLYALCAILLYRKTQLENSPKFENKAVKHESTAYRSANIHYEEFRLPTLARVYNLLP